MTRLKPRIKEWLRLRLEGLLIGSLRAAAQEQNLADLAARLERIVPDISSQYTTFRLESEYLKVKVRTQHAFQMRLVLDAMELLLDRPHRNPLVLVDVGDSSGTHLTYLQSLLAAEGRFGRHQLRTLSVNLDPVAVDKIRAQGMEAILVRAEDLYEQYHIKPDLCISLEMLEHLTDPIGFLDKMSRKSEAAYFVVSVPYRAASQVGLWHIRQGRPREVYPENTHIFELSPDDWKLLFQHAGWRVVKEVIYRQYPRYSLWRLMRGFWKRFDFEGFYGAILEPDLSWAKCYRADL